MKDKLKKPFISELIQKKKKKKVDLSRSDIVTFGFFYVQSTLFFLQESTLKRVRNESRVEIKVFENKTIITLIIIRIIA